MEHSDARMKDGETYEICIWLTGRETDALLAQWKVDCQAILADKAAEMGFIIGLMRFTEKPPGAERMPQVPDHISGPNVRLLIGEAEVRPNPRPEIIKSSGFVADLDAKDLHRLRTLTREARAKQAPYAAILTDAQCDDIIEQIGPETALKTLRGITGTGSIH